MEVQEKIETRKDEIRYRTADQRRMVGKYLASRVVKTWKEDFADKDTGEVITVERNSILFEKGKYIDEDTAISISFHIQSMRRCCRRRGKQPTPISPAHKELHPTPVQGYRPSWQ